MKLTLCYVICTFEMNFKKIIKSDLEFLLQKYLQFCYYMLQINPVLRVTPK